MLILSVPASCIVTAVIVGIQGQAFEAAFASGAVEHVFLAVAGVAVLIAIDITIGLSQLGERGQCEVNELWVGRWPMGSSTGLQLP